MELTPPFSTFVNSQSHGVTKMKKSAHENKNKNVLKDKAGDISYFCHC